MEFEGVKEKAMGAAEVWTSLSSEPAWTEIVAWLLPVIVIFLTLFAIEIRRGYRE